jgi:hypothetical protein
MCFSYKKYLKKSVWITSLLFIPFLVSAQADKTGVHFMPQVGVNLSKPIDETIDLEERFRVGYEAGFWIKTKSTVFIMPGAFYGQHGLNQVYIKDLENSYDTILNKVDYQTLKIPVIFGIQALGVRLYTGPSFTYVIDSDLPEFSPDDFRDLSMGLSIGAGFSFLLFSFDARFEYGVSHVLINQNMAVNTLTVSAGLKF